LDEAGVAFIIVANFVSLILAASGLIALAGRV
jgi:hypothetical protein